MPSSCSTPWQQRLNDASQQRRNLNQWRQRSTLSSQQGPLVERDGQQLINFCSNDYLGLAASGAAALAHSAQRWGLGSGASHLVCGHSSAHEELEQALAKHTGYPAALLFSTGYMANVGCINALTQRGDLILQDKLNHASLIDGALLSRADFLRYRHLDYAQLQHDVEHRQQQLQLQQQLQQRQQQPQNTQALTLVVSDSIFSMDGDLADVARLSQICQQQQALLMVDDAHGLGVIGTHGAGVRSAFDLGAAQLPVYIGTLGKGLGGFGAFVAGDQNLIDYLVQFARPYIYTTALPPAVAEAMLSNLERLQDDALRQTLNQHIRYFRQQASQLGLQLMPSVSPIQPLMIGDEAAAMAISAELQRRGLWVTAIRPPTVPDGSSRLRITLTAAHATEQIDALLSALDELIPESLRSATDNALPSQGSTL
tara:strand:- start:3219 stop:4499 length:1281 start_codon:yes stop_codon:yes gene_type:complete